MTYLLIFGVGFVSGFALIAIGRSQYTESLERNLKCARESREFWYARANEIIDLRDQVERVAAEMGK